LVAQIPYDAVYNTVARDDFMAMIDVACYTQRSDAFETIIARTMVGDDIAEAGLASLCEINQKKRKAVHQLSAL